MKNEKKAIGLKLVKDDCRINFGDVYPKEKDIIMDAFDNIWEYEEKNQSLLGEFAEAILDYFSESLNHISSNTSEDMNDCSYFLTATSGSYIIHNLELETEENNTSVSYSISKVELN
jgi:hypothetical protein